MPVRVDVRVRFRVCRRWLGIVALVGLCACRPDAAPSQTGPGAADGAERPAQAVQVLTQHLRDNDLAAFARDAVTPDLREPLDRAWREGRTRWPLGELPLGRRAPEMMAALSKPDADAHFRTLFDRQFARADGELRSTAATLALFAVQYLRGEGDFSTSERGHYTQLVTATGRWATTAPLSDPARAHAAIPKLTAAARQSGLRNADDFARFGMDDSLKRLSPFVAATKQALAGYGLDIDAGFDAMDASLQSQTGDSARVRMRYTFAGLPIDTVVDVERIDGTWYVSDFLRHARAAAAATSMDPDTGPAIPLPGAASPAEPANTPAGKPVAPPSA